MKKRILNTILSLCMTMTMVLSLLPLQAMAQELPQLSHAPGQDAALQSVAPQNIGLNEVAVENDLYEKMAIRASLIKLIDDIDIGTLSIDYEVTIDLNGHVLRAPYGGSVFNVKNGGHLTIIDSDPGAEHKFAPNADGLWVLDEANGTKTVKGGVITGGNAQRGGGVYIDGGTFEMSGGNIVGCTATDTNNSAWGGGVFVLSGQFNMTGGSIVGCTAVTQSGGAYGGGVYISGGTFTMTGGSITDCTVAAQNEGWAAWGGGICNYSQGTTTLSGTAKIQDCRATATSTNNHRGGGILDNGTFNISGDVTISGCTADGNSDAMLTYVGTISGGTFNGTVTNDCGTISGGTFYGGISGSGSITGLTVTYRASGTDYATQILQSSGTATPPTDPTNSANTKFLSWDKADGTAYDFAQPVTENITLTARFAAVTRGVDTKEALIAALADGTVDVIKLGSNIAIDATLNITRTVTLDLAGYMLEMQGSGSVIAVKDGGDLTIIDSNPTAEHKFTPDADGLWKWGNSGTKTINGGVIYGGTGTNMYYFTRGGGVYIEGGLFTMNGGSIVGCRADSGGGVVVACVDANGTFTMNGGAIIGCVADSGGGVETDGGGVGEFGTFIMNGGVIDSCVATDGRGGGVYASGPFTMGKAAAITNCKASEEGSGVFLGNSRSPHTLNGTITSEDANDGDYIFANNVQVTIGANAKINANITLAGGTIALADGVTSATVYGKITDGCFADGLVTVTYNVKGADYAAQMLNSGSAATKPTDPTNSAGTAFLGWYNGTEEYDFTQQVTENITLTARFAAVTREVKTKEELTAALANDTVDIIKLGSNIAIDATLNITRTVTLDLYGYMLEMKGSGSVIVVKDGGHLTLVDSVLTSTYYFTPDANDLWKWETSGTKTVNGGVIYGGNAGYGGGVYIEAGGGFTMNGGSIVGCQASRDSSGYGGGVYVAVGGAFEMNDGATIIGCVAVMGYGGGVYCEGGFAMNGGTIRDCTAFNYGAIDYRGEAPLTLNGTVIAGSKDINGNPNPDITGTTISTVSLPNSKVGDLILGDKANIQADMSISSGTVHANGGVVRGNVHSYRKLTFSVDEGVTGGTIIYGQIRGWYITIDVPAVTYQVNGKDYAIQILRSGSTATQPATPARTDHSFDGWYTSDGTKWNYNTTVTEDTLLTGSLYVPVTNESGLTAALADDTVDVIRLTDDIDISASLTILRKVTLDLNGHVLKMTGSGSVIILDDNNGKTGDLTIIDSDPTAEHRFKVNGVEPWVLDDSGTEIVKGGVITGGKGSKVFLSNGEEGGGVIIGDGALTMNGGNIVGCIARTGGGLYIHRTGAFTMNGGSIVGCSTPDRLTTGEACYSGIYVMGPNTYKSAGSVITLTGGLIKNNGRYDIAAMYNTTIYANGGEVYGQVHVDMASKITSLAEHTGVTAFRGWTMIEGASGGNVSHVDCGIYYGGLYFAGDGKYVTTGLTVTYKDGDNEYAKQVLPSGTLAMRPDDPTKQGYIFDGWYTADGAQWDYATDTVMENVTLTARWNVKTAEVKTAEELENALADDSVGQIRLVEDITLDGNTVIKVTEGRKVILDLGGHVLDLARKYISVSATSMGEGGTNIYPNQLTIIDSKPDAPHKFTPNADDLWVLDETGGTETVLGGIITGGNASSGGAMVVGLSGTVIMNGGNIVGCSADSSGGAVNVTGDGTFTMNDGNIVGCKATWSGGAVCVRSTFIMNGGSITHCVLGSPVGEGGAVWVRNGGTFTMTGGSIADCTAANGSGVYLDGSTMNADGGTVDGTVVLANSNSNSGVINGGSTTFSGLIINNNAQAEFDGVHSPLGIVGEKPTGVNGHNYCTVTFDPAGGTMEYTTRYFLQGENISDEIKPDPRTGYTFSGWYKADGTAWDYASDKVTDDITLYAKWTAKTYTVTFDTAGGLDIATKTMTATYGESLTNMPVPRREGYVFVGWYDAMAGGKCYGDSDGNGTDAYDKDGDTTLYAQWAEAPSREVRFNKCGGTMTDPAEVEHKINTPIAKPSDPTKAGYTFTGWYTDLTYTQLWNFDDWVTGEMMLYAGWNVNRYTITFDTAGGSKIDSITQDYGTTITAPANPTREGYTFVGWNKDVPETMPAESVTITAQWKINQYTITFDTAGGSKVDSITQDYGTTITAPADPTREGYTFVGWDKEIPATMPAENVTITAKWKVNQYKITFDTAGGSKIDSITQDYGTAITAPTDPTREGYTFIGWDKAIPATMPAENMTLKARWKDIEKPTGEIIIGTNKWSDFLNELTSGLFFKDPQEVTINAADNSGIVLASYLVTDQDLSETELKSFVYRAYENPFRIEPNGEYIIYVMLVDDSMNITYLRSDRITLDNIQPVISGIKDGRTYCEAQTVTIDEKYIDTVTINGIAVTLDENNSFILAPADGEQKIVVIDKVGNKAEMTVTVNNGHALLADDGDCTTPVYCKFCNAEVIAAKSHRFTGNWQNDEADHWHICQNENCTVTDTKTAHSGDDDGNCLTAVVCECGYVITAAKPAHTFNKWASNGNDTHTRKCTVVGCNGIEAEGCSGGKATCTERAVCTVCHTEYGNALGHNFTVAQHDETHHWNKCSRCDVTDTKADHTGGTATCREKAVCEVCHSDYGELSATNHVGGTEIRDAKPQSCTENGYTGDTYCKVCGKKLSSGTIINADGHKGGTATCTDKVECEVCHEKYGEPDANHHTELEVVDAVPATAASTGTVAYWRCTACGRLFDDADGKHEISFEDTVTKKLAPSILDGANSDWRKGNENGLTFSSDAAFSDFVEVLVDGKTVASENYAKQEGGIIVELKASYLETLAEGEHILTIRSASGDATTGFTIAASNSTNAWVWIIICFIALGIGVTVAVFVVRKRKTA